MSFGAQAHNFSDASPTVSTMKLEKRERSNQLSRFIIKRKTSKTIYGDSSSCDKAKGFLEAIGPEDQEV